MSDFEYKEIDVQGLETLDAISGAHNFNRWMYDTIQPFCSGEVIEIGSGIGNISRFFLENGYRITLSDIRDNYCKKLLELKPNYPNLVDVTNMDMVAPDFDMKYARFFNSFDTLFALNVIEHIKDDSLFLQNCRKLLKTNGNIIILAPAYQALYNTFDKELEHFRRYTKPTLSKLVVDNGFTLVHQQYFNMAGIPGWFISGKMNKTIPKGQMNLYNSLVPIFKIVDKLTLNQIGLSAISVGKKTE